MALRGGMSRRLPWNPMGSMLRDIDRRTRTTTRRGRPPQRAEEPQRTVEEVEPGKDVRPAPGPSAVAGIVLTGEGGRLRWTYPRAFAGPPVLTALPVDPAPNQDSGTVLAVVEAVTETHAEVRVWRTRPLRGSGVVEPAGPGLQVHITATPPTS